VVERLRVFRHVGFFVFGEAGPSAKGKRCRAAATIAIGPYSVPVFSQDPLVNQIRNSVMSEKNSVVAVLQSHNQAEDAVRELQKSGFDMTKLSIVGRDYHTDEH
jgi:hypothetical protein